MTAPFIMIVTLLGAVLGGAMIALGETRVAVAVGASGVVGIWLVRDTMRLAAIMCAAQYWGVLSIAGPGTTPFKLLLYLLIALVIRQIAVTRRVAPVPVPFMLGLVVLLFVIAVSELTSPYGVTTQLLSDYFGMALAVVCLTQVVRSGDDLRVFAIITMLGGLGGGIWAMVEMPWAAMNFESARARGPPGQSNTLGEMMVRAAPFAVAVALDVRNRAYLRLIGVATMAATIYGLLASSSRGATVAMAAAAVVLVVLVGATMDMTRRLGIAVIVGAILIFLTVSPPKSFERRVIRPLTGQMEGSREDWTSERLDHFLLTQRMIPERPFFGHGAGGFIFERGRTARGKWQVPHSAPLGMATAYGVPAAVLHQVLLAASILVALWIARRWRRHRLYLYGLAASTTASVVAGLSSPEFFRASAWMAVAMAYILLRLPESAHDDTVATAAPQADPSGDPPATVVIDTPSLIPPEPALPRPRRLQA